MSQDNQNKLAVILFAISCIALYFNSLWGIFLFDDNHTIPDNIYIKDIRYIPLFFKGYYTSDPLVPQGMFRPLLMLTFVFNYSFSRLAPLGYHIINVLIHFLNVIMFYSLLKFLKKDLPYGLLLLTSVLFLVHPINTEAVTYISARSDLMVCFFVVSGFLCYVRGRRFLGLILYISGLLCKETALILPFLILGYDFLNVPSGGNAGPRKKPFTRYLFYIVFFAISAAYWLYRQHLYGSSSVILANMHRIVRDPYSNILTQLAVSIFYLKLFIWPAPLITHHNFPILNSFSQPLALFSAIAIIVMIVLVFALRRKNFLISLGLFWYLMCLAPKFYSPLNIVAAEHHFYLPGYGIYLILAVLLSNLYLRSQRKFLIVSCGVIFIFAILAWFRNYEYTDEFVFWRKAAEEDPSSPVAHHNLGAVYIHKALYAEAEQEFKKTLSLSPPSAKRILATSWENLSNVYRLQKRYKEALTEQERAIKFNIATFGTYQNLGVIYLDMGEEEKAIEMWQKGLELNPQASGILMNLGLHFLRKSELSKAKDYLQKAIKYDPDSSLSYFGLGRVLQEEGQIEQAIKAFVECISISPNYADAHYHLGTLYAKKSDLRALNEFKEAVRLVPSHAKAHNNLAVIYALMEPQNLDLARFHARKALTYGYKVDKKFLEVINFSEGAGK